MRVCFWLLFYKSCWTCVGDGRCVICDSFVKPSTVVRVCDECNYGSYAGRCVVCGGVGVADAYYCKECTRLEKDVCCFVVVATGWTWCMNGMVTDWWLFCVCRGMVVQRL